MKKHMIMTLVSIVLAFVCVSCSSSSDDEMLEASETAGFSLLSFQKSEGISVSVNAASSSTNEEKLSCKILPGGKLWISHKNVVFDNGTDIKMAASLEGNKLIINETGSYGDAAGYGYYTLIATVGKMTDGDYAIIVKRNGFVRAEFRLTYDSSQASSSVSD